MQPPGGVPKMLSSFLQSLVLLTLTGKLIKITPCPFLLFVQWTWLYEHYKKHSLTCVLHRLQRQQTCPTCTLDVISGAPAAWPKPPEPTKVYEDCLSLLSGCIQQADCKESLKQCRPSVNKGTSVSSTWSKPSSWATPCSVLASRV